MNNIEELKRFIYSATVTSGSGSQSFYIDAKSREEADARAANNESDGMYADDSEVTDLDALEYEDETTVDYFGDFPLISREQSLIAQLEAAQKERDEFRLAFQQNEQAKQELFAQKDLLITANLNISRRAAKAEAELSAANEKLLVPVKKFGHNFGKPMGWAVVTNDGMLNGGVHDTERYARAVADSKEYAGKHRVIPLVSAFVEGNADAE
ncbi:TPA: hypothetical protein ACPZJF_000325 [Yersinia enterocolitica]